MAELARAESSGSPAAVPPTVPVSGWEPLRNRTFRALWIANVASGIGTTMHDTAATWAMTSLTTSPTLVTLMQTAASLPIFLLGLPAGALADIIDRRKLLIFAQVGGLILSCALAASAFLGWLTPVWLLGIAFLLGTAGAVGQPAWQASIPEIIERRALSASIALNSIGYNVARTVGPAVGGVIVAKAGPGWVFLLNGLSFVALLAVLIGWKREPTKQRQPEQVFGALVAAVRYARFAPPLRSVLFRTAIYVFAAVAPIALLPLLVKSNPQLHASDYGVLLGAYGAGAILCATLLLPRLRTRFSADQILAGALVTSALACVALAFLHDRFWMAAALILGGAAWLTSLTHFNTAVQTAVPNWIRARASSLQLITMQGAIALGAVVWGQLTSHTDLKVAFGAAAAFLILGLVSIRLFPLSRIAELDVTPSDHWAEHRLIAEPAPADGPVLITVEYRVSNEKADQFQEAIYKLRDVRLRDGAFRWDLFHSLDQDTIFIESFLVATWAEHLRQHTRAIAEDRHIEQLVETFHLGETPPKVRHYLRAGLKQ